jgi:HTH-type transcriptional regulator/antitoxin HigA
MVPGTELTTGGQRDLVDLFGSRGIAAEVVSGKRPISKVQAEKLAARFHVADLLL